MKNKQRLFPKVSLVPPSSAAYIHLAAEVDKRSPLLWQSNRKRSLVIHCKKLCEILEREHSVREAVVFTAIVIPPGRGTFIKRRKAAHVARFDLSVLIEVESVEAADIIRQHPNYQMLESAIRKESHYTHVITATNVRRIGAVDHKTKGVFLFNYFFADDTGENVDVWEYTAGWFEQETGLNNSTVLLPVDKSSTNYNIINHCRWDSLWQILPSLILKRTFRTFVLASFEANNVAAMPILYELA